ncbi:MAG: hypothetical protein Tsb0010_03400 [Parvularculaceae bacterium]
MRIPGRKVSPAARSALDGEILKAVRRERRAGRICGAHCQLKCDHCGSTACQCPCAPECPNAPRALSADPDNHPIERGVLPLVFALRACGFFEPCWSCEGHLGPAGNLWKAPRVWFYAAKPVHVRLLNGALAALAAGKRLHAPWRVAVTHSDVDNPEPTYSLEPALDQAGEPKLGALQADAATIASSLPDALADEARRLRRATLG